MHVTEGVWLQSSNLVTLWKDTWKMGILCYLIGSRAFIKCPSCATGLVSDVFCRVLCFHVTVCQKLHLMLNCGVVFAELWCGFCNLLTGKGEAVEDPSFQ